MNKNEFLEILQQQLVGEISSNEIYSNIHYYDDYIEKEIASGKTEEEVLDALGDPRLIAKTLIDADEAPSYNETYDADASSDYNYSKNRFEQANNSDNPDDDVPVTKVHRLDLSTWYGKALLIVIAAAVIFLLVTLLSALLPFILILALVGLVISYFKKRQ